MKTLGLKEFSQCCCSRLASGGVTAQRRTHRLAAPAAFVSPVQSHWWQIKDARFYFLFKLFIISTPRASPRSHSLCKATLPRATSSTSIMPPLAWTRRRGSQCTAQIGLLSAQHKPPARSTHFPRCSRALVPWCVRAPDDGQWVDDFPMGHPPPSPQQSLITPAAIIPAHQSGPPAAPRSPSVLSEWGSSRQRGGPATRPSSLTHSRMQR